MVRPNRARGMKELYDTIAAISTPRGVGAIAVVRMSGPEALTIAERLVREEGKGRLAPGRAVVLDVYALGEEGLPLDRCVVAYFRAPHSYTGEDVVEISCHGGPYVAGRVLEECLRAGARLAEPGEFTRRAFLHGKLDLAQVEAVSGIIYARSEERLRAAARQYRGELSARLERLRSELVELAARLELELDFAEEDVEFASREEIEARLGEALGEVERALATYRRGRRIWEGVRTVLVGRPNVGKSSLLNALLERERAIVTDVPGTTRDTVEDELTIEGVLFRLVDTAGLRTSAEGVEVLGIDRTWREVERADVVLWVVDGSLPLAQAVGEEAEGLVGAVRRTGADLIVVLNKVDLPAGVGADEVRRWAGDRPVVRVSARTGQGLADLTETLVRVAMEDDGRSGEREDVLLTTARQFEALTRAKEGLERALESAREGRGSELVAVDLREAVEAIGTVTGKVTTEEILDQIFANFCIGK